MMTMKAFQLAVLHRDTRLQESDNINKNQHGVAVSTIATANQLKKAYTHLSAFNFADSL